MAEAGDRAIDEARIDLAEAGVVEAVFRQTASLEVLDHDIGALGEAAHDVAPLGTLEIHRQRLLAAVAGMEIGGVEPFAIFAGEERRPPAARVVAGAGALDLDDLGAEIGQRLARPGPGEDAREFKNFQSGERFQRSLPLS